MSEEMRVWRSANPSLGRRVNEEAFEELMAEFLAEDRS